MTHLKLKMLRLEVPLKDDTRLILAVEVFPKSSLELSQLFQHLLQ